MSGHERERLSAYLDGELAPDERAAVEAHLAACPECTAFLANLAAVDEAAASLPAEAPPGYFDRFPARVRARLRPRKAAFPVRRVPVWTWAAAAALLLAVIAPLTLRQGRPAAYEARRSAPEPMAPAPAAVPLAAREVEPEPKLAAPEPRPTLLPQLPSPPPSGPPALRREEHAPAPAPAVTEAAPRQRRDLAAEGRFAPEPPAPARAETSPPKQQVPADTASDEAAGGVVGGVVGGVPQEPASREKAERVGPRPEVAAESASPMMAAGAGREATPASLWAQEDAFRRVEAVRPRTAAGWRRVREQWNALAAAELDPVRADEARVRAVIAAREAWKSGGDEGDEAAFRAQAESYLRRGDARQRPRVERLLAEAAARPAP